MRKATVPQLSIPPDGLNLREYLRTIERQIIKQAIDRTSSQTEAANLLGMTRAALWIKLHRMRSQPIK